jgi:hypothetical protein
MKPKLIIPASYLEDFENQFQGAGEIVKIANSNTARSVLVKQWHESGISSTEFDKLRGFPEGSMVLLLLKEDKKFDNDTIVLKKLVALFAKKRNETSPTEAKPEYNKIMEQVKKIRNYVLMEYPAATAFMMDYYQQLGGEKGLQGCGGLQSGLLFCSNHPIDVPNPYPDDGVEDQSFVVIFLLAIVIVGLVVILF